MASNLEDIFNSLKSYNPTAKNRWDTFQLPYSSGQEIGTVNQYTDLARKNAQKVGAGNVASARKGAANRTANYGGSIAEDAIAGAGENAAADTTNALTGIDLNRLGMLPNLMDSANKTAMSVTGQAQNTDFENIQNLLKQYGLEGQMGQELDAQPGILDDIFAGLGIATKTLGIPTGKNKFLGNSLGLF
jgi:hypothetical protein